MLVGRRYDKDALKLYAKDLEKIIAKQEVKVQKEKEKEAEKLKSIFEDYETEDDVMVACGYGFITERKRDKLLQLFKNKDKVDNEQSANGLYLNMLKRDLKDIRIEIIADEIEER